MTRTEALAVILPTLDLQTARLWEASDEKFLWTEDLCNDRLENAFGRSLPTLTDNARFTLAVIDAVEERLFDIVAGFSGTEY